LKLVQNKWTNTPTESFTHDKDQKSTEDGSFECAYDAGTLDAPPRERRLVTLAGLAQRGPACQGRTD
jgi:hypothetical protein